MALVEEKISKLLILDDNVLTGQTMRSMAEFAGLEVRFTTRSNDFFEWLGSWEPHFLAIDLIMPEMDGIEVMRRLANEHCKASIIITSGVGSRVLEAAERFALQHGLHIIGSLANPFSPAELRELLTRVVHQTEGSAERKMLARMSMDTFPSIEELRYAIHNDELSLVYQPKVHCQSGALVGFEALVRWNHPRLNMLSPDRFIPMAESEGLIDSITDVVINKSLDWLATIRAAARAEAGAGTVLDIPRQITMAINISAKSLSSFGVFDRLIHKCQSLLINPKHIILELTETSAMDDPVISLEVLTRLRVHGFKLSIDDFGTGYSSMVQLVRMPFSEIKVDRSFVMQAVQSDEARAVIRSVVNLGHSLGMQATAEGVEDEAALDYLREIGCDFAQGYHLGRPMRPEDFQSWYEQYQQSWESRRIASLRALNVLDTPNEARFDRLALLAQRLFNVPIALISLVDVQRQWFKSRVGFDARETPRNESFCTHAVKGRSVMVIEDATIDHRVARLPMVTGESHIRFYAGYPLRAQDGSRVGTLCVLDRKPRTFGLDDCNLLEELGHMVEQELTESRQSIIDYTSGLLSRISFERRAASTLQISSRMSLNVVIVVFELDLSIAESPSPDFQNDRVTQFAHLIKQCFRESDLIGRYSDHDFIVLAMINEAGAYPMIDRLYAHISDYNSHSLPAMKLVARHALVSVGGRASYDLQALMSEADKALSSQS